MKKTIPILLCLLTLTSCGKSDIVVPGTGRMWWHEEFNNLDEIPSFMIELKNAQKNGDFNFGVSYFNIPDLYKCLSIEFAGYIKPYTSREEDIYNSIYKHFEIRILYLEDTEVLPINKQVRVYFYPFYCTKENFSNEDIEYTFVDYDRGSYEATFTYGNTTIMHFKLTEESKAVIDEDQMIAELIQNYKLIV